MLNLSHFHVNGTVQTKQGRLVGVTHTRTTHMVGVRKGLGSDGLWPFNFWSPGHFRTQRARNNCLQWPWNYIHLSLHCMKVVSLFPLRVLWAFSCMFMLSLLIQSASWRYIDSIVLLLSSFLLFFVSTISSLSAQWTLTVRRGPHQLRC